jgi:hypothetical protein
MHCRVAVPPATRRDEEAITPVFLMDYAEVCLAKGKMILEEEVKKWKQLDLDQNK